MWAFMPARAYWMSRMPGVDRSSKSGAQAEGTLLPATAASWAASQSPAKRTSSSAMNALSRNVEPLSSSVAIRSVTER